MHQKPKARVAAAVSLAMTGLMLATSLNAGVINNTNPTAGKLGACGTTDADLAACVGAWDLGNVEVKLYHADGSVFGAFDAVTGVYTSMVAGDTFASLVSSADGHVAKVTGKVWPVGEPTGIKVVTGDAAVKNGKPDNCLINTDLEGTFLDVAAPMPVICSSPFQSHKRFKIAMQPATVDGIADGAEGKPIDLVFNVTDSGGIKPYQVFSKINNYTGKRLKGYRIVVGMGVGGAFQSADQLGIDEKLFISLGIGEGLTDADVADGSNLFDAGDGLATFSHGLFGAPDTHFTDNGFFDNRTAGFAVVSASEIDTWAANPLYYIDVIEDVLNLGLNYIVKVGDDLDNNVGTTSSQITLRIIPVVGDQTQAHPWTTMRPRAGICCRARLRPPRLLPLAVAEEDAAWVAAAASTRPCRRCWPQVWASSAGVAARGANNGPPICPAFGRGEAGARLACADAIRFAPARCV